MKAGPFQISIFHGDFFTMHYGSFLGSKSIRNCCCSLCFTFSSKKWKPHNGWFKYRVLFGNLYFEKPRNRNFLVIFNNFPQAFLLWEIKKYLWWFSQNTPKNLMIYWIFEQNWKNDGNSFGKRVFESVFYYHAYNFISGGGYPSWDESEHKRHRKSTH